MNSSFGFNVTSSNLKVNNISSQNASSLSPVAGSLRIQNLSLQILYATAPWFAALTTLTICQFLAGLVIFISILTSKNLRKNQTFLILANVAASDAVLAVSYMVLSCSEIYYYESNLPAPSTSRYCLYKGMGRVVSYATSNGFLLLLAANRLAGVAAPVWYQQHRARRVFTALFGVMYARTAVITLIYVVGVTDDPVPLCAYYSLSQWAGATLRAVSIIWLGSIAAIYVATIAITYLRLAIVRKNKGNVSEARTQLQVHVVWTLALILLVHVLTTTLGNAVLVIATNVSAGDVVIQNYVATIISACLISSSTALYLLVLVCRSGDFRQALMGLRRFCKGNAAVGAAAVRQETAESASNSRSGPKKVREAKLARVSD